MTLLVIFLSSILKGTNEMYSPPEITENVRIIYLLFTLEVAVLLGDSIPENCLNSTISSDYCFVVA